MNRTFLTLLCFIVLLTSWSAEALARRGSWRSSNLNFYNAKRLHLQTRSHLQQKIRNLKSGFNSKFYHAQRQQRRLLSMQKRILSSIPKDSSFRGAWIPLSLYQQLLRQKARKLDDARFGASHYKAVYVNGGFVVTGVVRVEASRDCWHRLPLVRQNFALLKVQWLQDKASSVHLLPATSSHDWVDVVFKGSGSRRLQFTFYVPAQTGVSPKASFEFTKASNIQLAVQFPNASYRPSLKGGIGTTLTLNSKKHRVLSTTLPGKVQTATVTWWEAASKNATVQKKPRLKRQSRLYARSFALLSLGQGGQELFFTVRYTIVHASRERFRLLIPNNIDVRRVLGLGIRDYRLIRLKGKPVQMLDVLLVESVSERYELSILGERRVKSNQMKILLPQPLDVQRETGFLGIEVNNNAEIQVSPKVAVTIDSRELPKTISQDSSRPILYASRFTRRPVSWTLKLRRHKNTSVPAAMIDFARYLQVSNRQGKTWVHATWKVRNTFKQFIAITLPRNSVVRSSFVGGRPVRPARDDKQRVLLPLKRSGGASGRSFSVELIYSFKEKAFRGKSHHRFNLPQVDLWTSQMQWRLYIPDGKASWKGKQWIQRQLLNRFRRYVRMTGKLAADQRPAGGTAFAPNKPLQQAAKNANMATGILPIRIQLPKTGRLYIFSRHHLASQDNTSLRLVHRAPWMRTLGLLLFVLGGFLWAIAIGLFQWLTPRAGLRNLTLGAGLLVTLLAFSLYGNMTIGTMLPGAAMGAMLLFVVQVLRFFDGKRKKA
jgi:hypothetical protein